MLKLIRFFRRPKDRARVHAWWPILRGTHDLLEKTAIPGGWLYRSTHFDDDGIETLVAMTFVPITDEYERCHNGTPGGLKK